MPTIPHWSVWEWRPALHALGHFGIRGCERLGILGVTVIVHLLLLWLLAPLFTIDTTTKPETEVTVRLWQPPPPPKPEPESEPEPEPPEPPEPEPVTDEPPPPDEAPAEVETEEPDPAPPSPLEPVVEDVQPSRVVPFGLIGNASPSPPGQRGGGRRGRALGRYGGNGGTESVVSEGLRWLAEHQHADGYWDPLRFNHECPDKSCAGSGKKENRVGVTALALLAFLGAGIDGVADTEYRAVAAKGLDYLVRRQRESGTLGGGSTFMYNHAIATYCLAEAAALTGDARYRQAVHRALRYTELAQNPAGAWDYGRWKRYGRDRVHRSDLSITGWQVMAIRTAARIGLDIEEENEERLRGYLATCRGRYADQKPIHPRSGNGVKAAWLLARMSYGESLEKVRKEAKFLLRRPPVYKPRGKKRQLERGIRSYFEGTYYWYYGTILAFHLGGEHWETWNASLIEHVLPHQEREGHARGSWKPAPHWVGRGGGRVATTAMMVLTFESYYRYDPAWERVENGAAERTTTER